MENKTVQQNINGYKWARFRRRRVRILPEASAGDNENLESERLSAKNQI